MKEKIKEIKLRVFPKNKENLIKIDYFRNRIITNRNHYHFVSALKKIPDKIPAPVGPGYWDITRFSEQQEFCGKIFFPFREFDDFLEQPANYANYWVVFFVCEEIAPALKWYCNLKKIEWQETTQEY